MGHSCNWLLARGKNLHSTHIIIINTLLKHTRQSTWCARARRQSMPVLDACALQRPLPSWCAMPQSTPVPLPCCPPHHRLPRRHWQTHHQQAIPAVVHTRQHRQAGPARPRSGPACPPGCCLQVRLLLDALQVVCAQGPLWGVGQVRVLVWGLVAV